MEKILFKNLDLLINNGELIGIIGPNGSGKTVFLKMICGKIRNEYIFIDNKNINEYTIVYKKKNIVCVFDDNIYNTDNACDEIRYYLKKLNVISSEIEDKVKYFTEYFNLENLINSNFSLLSVENRVFIKILSLLIINPCIICIDDLLTYLSIDKKIKILNYIKDNNITLLNVTSNMEELLLFDKILVMNKGKKEVFDTVDKVLNNEKLFKDLGLNLPFIYDINNLLKSYELIDVNHIVYKDLVNMLWK